MTSPRFFILTGGVHPAAIRDRAAAHGEVLALAAIAAGRALGRDEGAREASAGCYCKTRQFRVMDAPTGCPQFVPWWLLAPFEPQAKKNHDQTLERLNERGGLAPCEMLAVIEGRRWRKMDDTEAGRQLAKVVADAIARRGKEPK